MMCMPGIRLYVPLMRLVPHASCSLCPRRLNLASQLLQHIQPEKSVPEASFKQSVPHQHAPALRNLQSNGIVVIIVSKHFENLVTPAASIDPRVPEVCKKRVRKRCRGSYLLHEWTGSHELTSFKLY